MRPDDRKTERVKSRSVADLMVLMTSQTPQKIEPPKKSAFLRPFGLGFRGKPPQGDNR